MSKKLLPWLNGLLLLLIVAGLAVYLYQGNQPHKIDEAAETHEDTLGGPFSLKGPSGDVSLSQFAGKLSVIYFGYTSCPDICPTSLALFSQAMSQLTPAQQAKIQPLFITLDPARDSVDKMAQYLVYFHPSFIGLWGTDEEIAGIAQDYAVGFRRVDYENSALGYGIDHTSALYLVDSQGQVRYLIPHGADINEIARVLKLALQEPL